MLTKSEAWGTIAEWYEKLGHISGICECVYSLVASGKLGEINKSEMMKDIKVVFNKNTSDYWYPKDDEHAIIRAAHCRTMEEYAKASERIEYGEDEVGEVKKEEKKDELGYIVDKWIERTYPVFCVKPKHCEVLSRHFKELARIVKEHTLVEEDRYRVRWNILKRWIKQLHDYTVIGDQLSDEYLRVATNARKHLLRAMIHEMAELEKDRI